MMNLRASAKPFEIRGVLAKKTLHELKMYKTIPYTCMQKIAETEGCMLKDRDTPAEDGED